MATITPANLSYKDKDGDLGEVKSLTDTDVTLLNNALQDIEDLKLAYSPGFVKRDFSNVTQDGKDASISWDRPDYLSGVAITLTLNTDVSYTVPKNGFIAYTLSTTGSDYPTYLKVNGTSVIYSISFSTSGSPQSVAGMILVKKGDILTIRAGGENADYMRNGDNNATFFPCQGAN